MFMSVVDCKDENLFDSCWKHCRMCIDHDNHLLLLVRHVKMISTTNEYVSIIYEITGKYYQGIYRTTNESMANKQCWISMFVQCSLSCFVCLFMLLNICWTVFFVVYVKFEWKQLIERIEQRHRSVTQLLEQQKEFEQKLSTLIHWYDDKQQCLSTNSTMIPLKMLDIEHCQNKYQVFIHMFIFVGSMSFNGIV
jgi:hypothetical protein